MVEEQNSLILNDLVEHLWSVRELSTEQGRVEGWASPSWSTNWTKPTDSALSWRESAERRGLKAWVGVQRHAPAGKAPS